MPGKIEKTNWEKIITKYIQKRDYLYHHMNKSYIGKKKPSKWNKEAGYRQIVSRGEL